MRLVAVVPVFSTVLTMTGRDVPSLAFQTYWQTCLLSGDRQSIRYDRYGRRADRKLWAETGRSAPERDWRNSAIRLTTHCCPSR